MTILSHTNGKNKTKRLKGFRFDIFIGHCQVVSWQWGGSSNSEGSFLSVLWMSHCSCHSLKNWPDLPRNHGPIWNSNNKKHHNAGARHPFYIHVLWFWTACVLFLPRLNFPQGCNEGSVVRKYRKKCKRSSYHGDYDGCCRVQQPQQRQPCRWWSSWGFRRGNNRSVCSECTLCPEPAMQGVLLVVAFWHTARIPFPNPWPFWLTSPLCHWYCPFCLHVLSVLPRSMISIQLTSPLCHWYCPFCLHALSVLSRWSSFLNPWFIYWWLLCIVLFSAFEQIRCALVAFAALWLHVALNEWL